MHIRKMAAPLGGIVTGLDIRAVDDDTWRQLNHWFCEYHLLVFPDQDLRPADHVAFAERWGPTIPFPYGGLPDHPNVIELRNRGKAKDINQHWHSDMTYNTSPPKLTMLYALEAPEFGGETAFANQALAYDELSVGMKRVVDGLVGLHSAEDLARVYGEDPAAAPRAEHPVVRTHDESGERSLYVCKAFTTRFKDWTREESRWLLNFLFEHGIRPEFQARHQWRPGDLVMWDNRCLMHYAVHDHGDDVRVIHRCQVEGPVPQ